MASTITPDDSMAWPWFLRHYQDVAEMLCRWIDADMTFHNVDEYPVVMDSLYCGVKNLADSVMIAIDDLKGNEGGVLQETAKQEPPWAG